MLGSYEFEALYAIYAKGARTQRAVAAASGLSLGTANATIKALRAFGLVDDSLAPTDAALDALAPFKVDNAVIMAAGLSSRFAPISYEKPKGVLRVRGEVLIERQIRQLREAGIDDITVVVGYKKEEFFYLEDLFGVRIVINHEYATRNNNSTIRCVQHLLGNTYICSSDDYFTENPFEPYVFRAYYSATFASGPTEEWCLVTKGKERLISGVEVGGRDSWIMLGHVYWDRAFSQTFGRILDAEYDDPACAPRLWEEIYAAHIDELPMVMRPYEDGVIWEFDSLADLQEFDSDFIDNVDSAIMDHVCRMLGCARSDIHGIVPLKQGLTNLSFAFEVKGRRYAYRHPGVGSDAFIRRSAEVAAESIAYELGLDRSFIFEDVTDGWKLSRFIAAREPFDGRNVAHVDAAMAAARTLHVSGAVVERSADPLKDAESYLEALSADRRISFRDFPEMHEQARRLHAFLARTESGIVLSHGDFCADNLILGNEGLCVIDWERAGMTWPEVDPATFACCCADYSFDDAIAAFESYAGRASEPLARARYVACLSLVSFDRFVRAVYQDMMGKSVDEPLHSWYRFAKAYGRRAEEFIAILDEA